MSVAGVRSVAGGVIGVASDLTLGIRCDIDTKSVAFVLSSRPLSLRPTATQSSHTHTHTLERLRRCHNADADVAETSAK